MIIKANSANALAFIPQISWKAKVYGHCHWMQLTTTSEATWPISMGKIKAGAKNNLV